MHRFTFMLCAKYSVYVDVINDVNLKSELETKQNQEKFQIEMH